MDNITSELMLVIEEFPSPILKSKDSNIQYYKFKCCFIYMMNLISQSKLRTQTKGLCESGNEANI